MDDETVSEVFNPFFSTKKAGQGIGLGLSICHNIIETHKGIITIESELGKGTGLGLSTAHGIVTSHGGNIFVESEVGRGTTFTVYIPKAEDGKGKEDSQSAMPVPYGDERILLVDDEEPITKMYKQMLGNLGYIVDGKISSSEALRAFQANPYDFDLVITDQTMPKMTGEVLAEKLIKIRSDIPIILWTGYSNLITEEKAKAIGIKKLIMKPILMRELSESIRLVLDQNK